MRAANVPIIHAHNIFERHVAGVWYAQGGDTQTSDFAPYLVDLLPFFSSAKVPTLPPPPPLLFSSLWLTRAL